MQAEPGYHLDPQDPRRDWAVMTVAARNAAYDSNAAVANSPALIERRNRDSAAFRAAHSQVLDVAYGPRERNRWDFYLAADRSAPCMVFVHGGYWQRNSREAFAIVAQGLTAHGWSAALPGHTLAPHASLTEIVEEIGTALDWLSARKSDYGLTGPFILAGWSSGAHLAAMAMGHPLVDAGLLISGVFELGPLRDMFANDNLRLTDDEVAALSPSRLSPTPKPVSIAYGSRELAILVADARNLHARRAAMHLPGPLIPVAGADHFSILDEISRPDGCLVRAARDLAAGLSSERGRVAAAAE